MALDTKKPTKRKKPRFLRQGWNKMIKLGKSTNKKKKWRAPRGRHSKVRARKRGFALAPTIGWGSDRRIRDTINGLNVIRIDNVKQLEQVEKNSGILISRVGKKKRAEIVKIAKEKGIKILNKYREGSVENKTPGEKNATS